MDMSFRENLRYIMDSKGLQTKELSQRTKISENTIKSYLKSDSSEPKISKAIIIAKALSVSVEFLVTGINNYNDKTSLELNITDNLPNLEERDLLIVSNMISTMIKTKNL